MTSVLGNTAFWHMQTAQPHQIIAAVECLAVAHRRYCRRKIDVGKRTAIKGKRADETGSTAKMNLRETCARLKRGLRYGGEFVGNNNTLHTAAKEYRFSYLADIIGHCEMGDMAVAESIIKNPRCS